MSNRNNPISPMLQILITLRFYATGSFQIVEGDLCGVSRSTVCRKIRRVSKQIAQLSIQFIKFPQGNERMKVIQDFYEMARFPGVIGAIDCTHIPIQSPGGDNAELFRNRKGYFSINVQTISDPHLLIRDIVACWYGSTHDSTIFLGSQIRRKFSTNEVTNCHLLGDSGYKLEKYLLTPFLNPTNVHERNYNKCQIKTRNTVERQYGVWKRRFPCLKFGLRTKLQTSLTVIVATAVLHNIAILTRDEEPPEDVLLTDYFSRRRLNIPQQPIPNNGDLNENRDVREAIPNLYRKRFAESYF